MELHKFVSESIKQVVDGVLEAQDYCKSKKASINPRNVKVGDGKQIQNESFILVHSDTSQSHILQVLNFDIAITVSEGEQAKGGITVLGGMINLGVGAQAETEQIIVNRLKFSIPISFPEQTLK